MIYLLKRGKKLEVKLIPNSWMVCAYDLTSSFYKRTFSSFTSRELHFISFCLV